MISAVILALAIHWPWNHHRSIPPRGPFIMVLVNGELPEKPIRRNDFIRVRRD